MKTKAGDKHHFSSLPLLPNASTFTRALQYNGNIGQLCSQSPSPLFYKISTYDVLALGQIWGCSDKQER